MEKEKSFNFEMVFKWSVILAVAIMAFIVALAVLNRIGGDAETVPAAVTVTDVINGEPVEKKYTVTSEFLEKNLRNVGMLSTVEASYNGVITAENGKYKIFTEKGYSMYYIGTVTAGIDVNKIDISINDNKVVVTVPTAVMQEPVVDTDSIVFANVKKALFNWTTLEDGIDGIKFAEKELKLQAHEDDILSKADEQAENIIRTLLEDIVRNSEGEPELVIIRTEADDE